MGVAITPTPPLVSYAYVSIQQLCQIITLEYSYTETGNIFRDNISRLQPPKMFFAET